MIEPRDARSAAGDFPLSRIRHDEQEVTPHGAVRPACRARTTCRIAESRNKGQNAPAMAESVMVDAETGTAPASSRRTIFIRTAGGFGGPRGGDTLPPVPERAADEVVRYAIRPDQAVLDRMPSDRNPLHSDPVPAKKAAFGPPILHRTCVFGFAGRALLHTVCGPGPALLGAIAVRFAHPTLPLDILDVSIWDDADGARFKVPVGDRVVLGRGRFTWSTT
ncbi:MaoC/PaaZ C-terminal domain-containing protein [Streptomyces sp. CA-100214]